MDREPPPSLVEAAHNLGYRLIPYSRIKQLEISIERDEYLPIAYWEAYKDAYIRTTICEELSKKLIEYKKVTCETQRQDYSLATIIINTRLEIIVPDAPSS